MKRSSNGFDSYRLSWFARITSGLGASLGAGLSLLLMASSSLGQVIDRNGNGISDVWEDEYQIPPGDLGLDSDGDGSSNRDEGRFATNPDDPASLFRADSAVDKEGTTIFWSGLSFHRYRLQRSTDLNLWSEVGEADLLGAEVPQSLRWSLFSGAGNR